MKQWWQKQSVRIDALTLRERGFLFMSVILVLLALADVLWLSPAQMAHTQMTQRFAAQGQELTRLRAELTTAARPVDANKSAREDLVLANTQIQAINDQIRALLPVTAGGPELEQVLVHFLRRQEGLTLLGIATQKQETSATASAPIGLSRRGLELRVSGPYSELVRYVKTLETALPNLRWGPMLLKRDARAASELTLQVYVLGVAP